MKKIVFTLGICMVAAVCFGQKKAVTDALKLAKDAVNPNFAEARTKIKAALQHPETMNDAKTWFSAGQVEGYQFDMESKKLYLGQEPNYAVMYDALIEIYPYYAKAYELDKLPDEKGKVKPKYTKDMKSIMKANLPYYINGGSFFFDQEQHARAFEFFDQLVTIYDSPLMTDGETVKPTLDSNYVHTNFYAAVASLALDHETAIKAITRALKFDFNLNDLYQCLAQTYYKANDLDNFEKALTDGLALFPEEEWFMNNLINFYLEVERNDKVLEYTLRAIKINPTEQLYNIAGFIYERSVKDDAKAEEYYKKAIDLNGENAESQTNCGRIFFNQGVTQLDIANEITDVKKYNEERDKAKELFRKALPYFEKALQLNPEAMDNKIALRSIYYNLDMGDKLDEIEKLMGE